VTHTDLDERPPPVPRATEEFNALWDRVLSGAIPDPTPYGMGCDHCPYCFADWKEPPRRELRPPGPGSGRSCVDDWIERLNGAAARGKAPK
jgi:hypothetical protein